VYLPPLRERVGDIPILADHFVNKYVERNHKEVLGISQEAIDQLCRYGWPGNVRELENAIERAIILTTGQYLTARDLPEALQGATTARDTVKVGPLKDELEVAEKQILEEALKQNEWNRHKTATTLGINRTTLYHKMKKYGWV
jgi:DNA-binding NtrC family response regulator